MNKMRKPAPDFCDSCLAFGRKPSENSSSFTPHVQINNCI